ncbi:MAG: hypothetical protein ACKN84_05260, partial [Candidatus Fonsibacter sp.]
LNFSLSLSLINFFVFEIEKKVNFKCHISDIRTCTFAYNILSNNIHYNNSRSGNVTKKKNAM